MVCTQIDVYEAKTSPDSEVVPKPLLRPDILISFRCQCYIITIVVNSNAMKQAATILLYRY